MYQRRIERDHPGCFLFLIDQSYSMNEPVAGRQSQSKSAALAETINDVLYELVLRCVKNPSEGLRHYYDVGVIGYGSSVGPAFGGQLAGAELASIVDIANNPLRIEERDTSTVDGAGGSKRPVWFEAVADGATPMSSAMDTAGRIVAGWVKANPASFPPIIINVSDGAATDGDPSVWAQRLTSLATEDGPALLFNVNISALGGAPLFFPGDPAVLTDTYARQMFDISSPLPGFMAELAGMQGHAVTAGARGFVFNADISSVANFLQIGTATHHVAAAR